MASDDNNQFWLIGTPGVQRTEWVAEVALQLRVFHTYTFSVPSHLRAAMQPGVAVRIPARHGKRLIDGWCLRISERSWDNTRRAIDSIVNPLALLTPELVDLLLWISDYYACPPGATLKAVLPAAARKLKQRRQRIIRRAERIEFSRLSESRKQVLSVLESGPLTQQILQEKTSVSTATLRAMVKSGLLEIETRIETVPAASVMTEESLIPKTASEDETSPGEPEDGFDLTEGQKLAIETVTRALHEPDKFAVHLLFGVPGSGKTEIYVRTIRAVIALGKQAIVLVPEIALATQVVQRLAKRFSRVAVLHSRLTAAKRVAALQAVRAGLVDVVIGTRSAVFAPLPNLGLVVVDEEQEGSFKSLSAPFYHARDVAIKRAQIERIPILLGSATPSLESWHNATDLKRFSLLRLGERVPGARLPRVTAIDLSRDPLGDRVLSKQLRDSLRETLSAGEQAILLHNRRGYAAHLRCASCGLAVSCPRCTAHMIEHRERDVLKCHRCGATRPRPAHCLDSTCRGELQRTGLAIQKLEEELRRALPNARLIRLDRDTMRKREDYADALGKFERREADILLGTQMVAKGLDFPAVKLVGVLDADAMLNLPDFRAAEQGFQLLTQVVGRAGRKQGDSLALIQSETPDNPVLRHALTLDFESFASEELAVRKELGYPPFGRLVRFVCLDPNADTARDAARLLENGLRDLATRISAAITIHESQPCLIARLRDLFRWEIVVRSPRNDAAQKLLRAAHSAKLFSVRTKRLTIDVDPIDML